VANNSANGALVWEFVAMYTLFEMSEEGKVTNIFGPFDSEELAGNFVTSFSMTAKRFSSPS
jgi:hypothetical protein